MLRLILNNLLKRRERASLVVVSAVLIAAAFALFVSASSATTVSADQALNQYWRTTYDILVRHPDMVTDIERKYGLVEANHLSGTPGGITFEQYEIIKEIEGVEIAAPIAMLGYVPRNRIILGILDPFPTGIYRVTASSTIDDGYKIHEFTLPAPYYSTYYQGYDIRSSDEVRQDFSNQFVRLKLFGASSADFAGFRIRLPDFDNSVLLAAIDPEQEARLLNLDQMVVKDQYLASETELLQDGNGYPIVPILLNVEDYIQQAVTVRIEQVNIGDFPIEENGYLDAAFVESLSAIESWEQIDAAPRELFWEGTYPLERAWIGTGLTIQLLEGQFLDPYRGGLSGGLIGQLRTPAPVEYVFLSDPPEFLPSSTLVLEAVPRGLTETQEAHFLDQWELPEILAVTEQGNWQREPEIVFRDLVLRFDEWLSVKPIVQGVFEIDPIAALGERSPNQVPLETYLPPLVTLKYDAEGNPVEGDPTLRPTLNYEGYLVSPPDILMSLESARGLLEYGCFNYAGPEYGEDFWKSIKADCSGSKDDIISAIRIRVGDIEELTPEAQVRIEQIAQQIVEETGLHVDIMVGSSPEPVLVHIPGYGEVPELGYVEELWIKKGVSTLVTQGINRADSLLFGLMLLVSLLFLFNANYVSVLGRMPEFGVMLALGWRRASLFTMILGEGALLGLLSSALGTVAAWGLVQNFGLPISLNRILWLLPLGSLLFLLGSLLPAWMASRAQPSSVMRAGETQAAARVPKGANLWSYAAGGVLRRPGRSLITVLGLALSSAFLVLLKLVLDGLDGALYGTLLGQWVRTQVQPFHFMMAGVALLAAALGAAVLMLLNIMQRRHEIGLLVALGWRRTDLLRVFLLESGLLALFSGLLGTVAGLAVFFFAYGNLPADLMGWLQVGGLGVLLPLAVVEVATLYPANRGARLLPLEAFRGEERLTAGLGLGRSVAWVGALGALGLVLAIGAFWAGGGLPEPAATPQAALIDENPIATVEPAPDPLPTPTPVAIESLTTFDIQLDIDVEAMQAQGLAQVHFVNQTGEVLENIVFRLYPNYPIRMADGELLIEDRLVVSAVLVAEQAMDFEMMREMAAINIPLENPLSAGESLDLRLQFEYEIPRSIVGEEKVVELYSFFSVLAMYDESGWRTDVCESCLNDFYSPMANYRYSFTAPEGWDVVGTGERLSETPTGDGRIQYDYEASPVRDLAIAMGENLLIESTEIDGVALNVYGVEGEERDHEVISQIAGQIIRFMQENVGAYPYPSLNVVLLPASFTSGLDYPQLSFVVYETIDTELEQTLARYIAYQWWFQVVGVDFYNHAWLGEALSDYAALAYIEKNLGADVSEELLRQYQTEVSVTELEHNREYGLDTPVNEINEAAPFLYLDIAQRKGALFLDELRQLVGDVAFFTGLQNYYLQYRFGVGDSGDFLEVMQQAAGQNLRPIFEEWGALNSDT